MLNAIFHHLLLLLAFSHSGRGLPTKWPGVLLALGLFLAAGVAKGGVNLDSVGVLAALSGIGMACIAAFGAPVASGFMLISAALDAGALVFPMAPRTLWAAWEFTACMALVFKVAAVRS